MRITTSAPKTWQELQDKVAKYLNEAGYKATTPCAIDTVRGKVEVDVYVESQDEMVKKIICECKFWNTPVTKEKVHAFRTVVYDSGATLGILISKNGFQSGAIEAAKYSNVILVTWNSFIELIFDKWVIARLKKIKTESSVISIYTDPLDFPSERIISEDILKYKEACVRYIPLRGTCWMISKTDLINYNGDANFYRISEFDSIDSYLNFLSTEIIKARNEFEEICKNSKIIIKPEESNKLEGYLFMYLN